MSGCSAPYRSSVRIATLLIPAAVTLAGCSRGPGVLESRAEAKPPAAPASPRPVSGPERLVLTGELVAVKATDIFVPAVPTWQVQVKWLETDGAVVKQGQTLVQLDNGPFAGQLEEKKLASQQAEMDLTRQQAEAQATVADKAFAVEQKRAARDKAVVDAAIPLELRAQREAQEKQLALARSETELAKAVEELTAARKTAQADVDLKRLALASLRREIEIAERAIEALSVKAPGDGVFVVGENPRERRKIQLGDMIWVGLKIGTIPETTAFRVDAALYDVDDGRVKKRDRATVVLDADPSAKLTGTVTDVAAIAAEVNRESLRRTLRLSLAIDGLQGRAFRPGQSVKVVLGETAAADTVASAQASAPVIPIAPNDGPTVPVRRGDLVESVPVTGTLKAVDTSALGPPAIPNLWEFRIAKMSPEGAPVKEGEVVLAFDTTEQVRLLDEQKAERDAAERQLEKRKDELAIARRERAYQLSEAKTKLEKARLDTSVPAELRGANDLRKAAIDLALAEREHAYQLEREAMRTRAEAAELEGLERKLAGARVRVTDIETRIERLTVKAPRTGTVLYVMNWRDEKKKVGDNCWQGEKVLEIPDLTRMIVKADADEAELYRLSTGQGTSLSLEAQADRTFTGKVTTIGRTVERQSPRQPKKVVRLDVSVDSADAKAMRPGMRVRGSVETGRVPGVLLVPLASVFRSPDGPVVFKKSWSGFTMAPVALGRRNATEVEVTKGVADGEQLWNGNLAPGKKSA